MFIFKCKPEYNVDPYFLSVNSAYFVFINYSVQLVYTNSDYATHFCVLCNHGMLETIPNSISMGVTYVGL